jgi:PKD repeat protein
LARKISLDKIKIVLICSSIVLGTLLTPSLAASPEQSHNNGMILAPSGATFDYIVTVLMENNGYCEVITACGGSGTYQTSLAATYGLAGTCQSDSSCSIGGYTAIDHPSEGNYVQLIGGSDYGFTGDCGYCPARTSAVNIIDRIEASGRTWDAWYEGGSGSGTCSANPPRGGDHYAFITFTDIQTNTARCNHLLSTTPSTDSEFLAELNSANPANYMWLTPTDSNNCHDTVMSFCDNYLKTLVPKILSSSLFTTKKAALWIQYDEGNSNYPNDFIYGSWSGPVVKNAYVGSGSYNHYSYLKTIEAVWGLSSLTSNDANAAPMTEFFGSVTPPTISTTFTVSTITPIVNAPVTFTATTVGGTPPYSVSWNFGDGATGTGSVVTHTYSSAKSFSVTETATDSSSPQQSSTSSQTVTAVSSLTGNFGVCASLPQGWNCGNLHPSAPNPSSAQIVNGVFQSFQSNPGLGGPNDYYYSTTQKGTFPWTPCTAPASGVLPSGITSVTANFTFLTYDPGSSPTSDRYHIYIALYYWLPNGPVTAGGSTYRCLDTQVRVENIGGTFSPIGSTATYNPGDSFGWDQVTLQISPGQTGTLVANVADLCLQDLQAWGIPTNTPCQLAGIEIGTEGYQFQDLAVNWYDVNLNVGLTPLSTSFTSSPSNPMVNTPVTFTASTLGGKSPYAISWNFGDGSSGSGPSIIHTFASVQSFAVSETATDSSSPSQTVTSSMTVTVRPTPPLSTGFNFLPTTPLVNMRVAFTETTTGGTPPYIITWNFGDGTTGTGAATSHTYATAGTFTVTETATDSSTPAKTATDSQSVTVYTTLPLSTSFSISSSSPQVGQAVTFSATATGGTSPYSYSIAFGDGASGTGSRVTYAYSAPGTYAATVTVTDSASPQVSISKTVTVNVQALIPPVLTLPGNQTVIAGSWINFTISATSANSGGSVTLSTADLPTGAVFDPVTGLFSWKPGASQAGSYVIVFTATDNSYPSAPTSKPMTIQVKQAAPGPNGGTGGSGGSSNGSCPLCGIIPKVSPTIGLLAIGGLIGLVSALAALTIRARASLERTKRRLRN